MVHRQEELWEKFSLRFEVVDRRETERLRRRLSHLYRALHEYSDFQ